MVKKGRKKVVKEASPSKPIPDLGVSSLVNPKLQFEEKQCAFNDREVERRITAIQAITSAEIENLLSRLRLLRSYFTDEQLQTPALQFFKDNCPNLSVVKNDKYQIFELEWNDKDIGFPMNTANGGLHFSTRSVKTNILKAASLHIPDCAPGEPPEIQFPGFRDSLQTPGATCNRLSFGMTPKTLRLPKHGEMLLSAQGSPLGVYKEENLESIRESEDGSS